jgi:hypothetical protein
VIARFDELFERRHPSPTPESAVLLDRICASWRAQNRAAAAALVAVGELFGYRLARCSDTEEWAIDSEEAVSAELAAALRISQGLAGSQLRYARAMRERLTPTTNRPRPKPGAVLRLPRQRQLHQRRPARDVLRHKPIRHRALVDLCQPFLHQHPQHSPD